MRLGHMREAMTIVEELANARDLRLYIRRLSEDDKNHWRTVNRMRPGRRDYATFQKYIRLVRNKAAFHYDAQATQSALDRLAAGDVTGTCTILNTHSTQIRRSRFVAADSIVVVNICGEQWGIDPSTTGDPGKAINAACEWTGKRGNALYQFGREIGRAHV